MTVYAAYAISIIFLSHTRYQWQRISEWDRLTAIVLGTGGNPASVENNRTFGVTIVRFEGGRNASEQTRFIPKLVLAFGSLYRSCQIKLILEPPHCICRLTWQ